MYSISLSNKKDIEKINVHDSVFSGYVYDYDNKQIRFSCSNNYPLNQCFNFCFYNVIFVEVQGCSFWHGGNNILGIFIEETSAQLDQLYQLQKAKKDLYAGSYLDKGITYITVEIQLNSGDTILIICEKIECDTLLN